MPNSAPTNPRNVAYRALATALEALAIARADLSDALKETEHAHLDDELKADWRREAACRVELAKAFKSALKETPKSSHLHHGMRVHWDVVVTVDSTVVRALARSYRQLAADNLEAVDAYAAEQLGALDAEGEFETATPAVVAG